MDVFWDTTARSYYQRRSQKQSALQGVTNGNHQNKETETLRSQSRMKDERLLKLTTFGQVEGVRSRERPPRIKMD